MGEQPLPAGASDAFQTYRQEQSHLAGSQSRQRQAQDGEIGQIPAAHPLEFDERGFPVAQTTGGGLTERIRRLLAVPPRPEPFNRRTQT